MVAEKIVGLDNLDIVDLRSLQNFPGALGAGDVRARAHFAPAIERAAHANLRPDAENQRNADVK